MSRQNACRDPAARELYIHNLRKLQELTNVFMLTIESNVSKIPFGIRYIALQIFECVKVSSHNVLSGSILTDVQKRFQGSSDDDAIKVVSNFIYHRYLNWQQHLENYCF